MDTENTNGGEVVDPPARTRALRHERPRAPLFLKIFLLTALLVIIVVGLAIGVTLQRADAIASATVKSSISSAATLFADLQETRLRELALGANSVGRDPTFTAYIQSAQQGNATGAPNANATDAPAVDTTSILDQLGERQQVLKSDLLIATNGEGYVLARTDQPASANSQPQDLYSAQPLLAAAVDSPAGETLTGTMLIGDRMYHAAIAPINAGAGAVRTGYIVNAYRIDEKFANQIAKTTRADVAFVPLAKRKQNDAPVPRSTDAPGLQSINSMGEIDMLLGGAQMVAPHEVTVGGARYVMTGQRLATAGKPVGAAVFLRSVDKELTPFREIERTLLASGALALLLAFGLSWLLSRRLTRPVEKLAGYAQAVTAGDYSVQPETGRNDEIGILSRAFAQMISALRDKAELEELYAEMSARMQQREPAGEARRVDAPRSEEATILVTDLRGVASSGRAPDEVIQRMTETMTLQEREIVRQEGRVREIVGHRLVCTFEGERSVLHALRAARAISEELAGGTDRSEPLSIGVGIATGEFVSGGVRLASESGLALVGNAPLLALLLAWEAPTGCAYVSLESAQALGADILKNATKDEVRLRWLPAAVPLYSMPLQEISSTMVRTIGAESLSYASTLRLDESASGSQPSGTLSRELVPGTTFANRYAIEQVVGRGGMGVVYRATDRQLDETVAIKTLPGDAMNRSSEEVERFKREIRLARKITHRNVLRTFDYGEAEGVYFISMEYVRGYTLAELLEETPRMAIRPAMGIARQICRGLQAAHDEAIIHRDIKPQNVLVDQKGQVKLMDFGIARRTESAEAMTSAGLIVGTPHYMSPEQVQGKTLDARSDVYAMGVMMYEMLCGTKPIDAGSLMGVLTAHLTEKVKPAIDLRPELGKDVNRIIMRCLEKDPSKRYADAGELLEALDALPQAGAAAAAA